MSEGFTDIYINSITADSEFEDEMFYKIFEIPDIVEREKYIAAIRKKSKSLGRLKEFNDLFGAWKEKNAQLIKQEGSNKTEFTDAPITLDCGRYVANDTGINITEITKTGSINRAVCPHPILPVERLVNIDTETEKLKLAFFKDARWRNITVDCGTAFNKSYISSLADRGIIVTSESAKELVKYLAEVVSLNLNKIPLYRSIARMGWMDNEFAPYVQAVKYDGDMDFQSIYEHVKECGEYKIWLDHITELRNDINIRLMLDTSFASPLIQKIGALPFVLHLWGTTGFGKTVSLMVAASVWGDPEMGCLTRTMNMTANAMARTAAFLYSIPFCADELQQIKSRWDNYDSLIMYVTEGIDRGRAKRTGGVEDVKIWKNAFIFTGEEPVTKESSGGGAKNRCIEIEVRDKIIKDGNKTANLVKENYGFAGEKYIKYLQELGTEQIREDYKKIFDLIIETCSTTEKQAMSMALILLADKYSCECIFKGTPLPVSDVKGYLASESTVDMTERAYEWCINWIDENSIRFTDNTDINKGAIWGKLDGDSVLINKNVLVNEMNKVGYDLSACCRNWSEKGYLIRNSRGKYIHQTKAYGVKASYIKLNLPQDEENETVETPFD